MTTRILLFVVLAATAAYGATVRGTVTATTATTPPPRYVTRSGDAHGQHDNVSTNAPLVAVILDPVNAAAATPPDPVVDTPQVMAQAGTRFVPNLVIVPVGGVVSFPNHDPIFHNVFSYSSVRTFDLGRYPKGETRTVTFPDPGIVRVFCEIHSSMYASIVVTSSPWHQMIPAGSEFEFAGVPAGEYRLLATDAAGRHTTAGVTVKSGDTRPVALTLGK